MKHIKNNIFIISAPSGAGKSTLIKLLLTRMTSLFFSISHTTRAPREGENDGSDYFFIGEERFQEMIRNDLFLEWAMVHEKYYGTSREMVVLAQREDKDLVLDIDVQGAASVRSKIPEAVSIFILPPSYEVLRDRLIQRQKDSPEQIARRIENARREIAFWKDYDYIVINKELQAACESLTAIISSQFYKREKIEEIVRKVVKSFEISE